MHKNTFTSISDEDFLAGEKSFMQGGFGYGGGIQATAPITEDMQMLLAGDSDLDLMLGGDKVVAKYFGHGQTPGDQFVWHERSQTLFCGNPIIADGPSMPWLLDGNVAGAKQAMVNMKEFVDTKANPVMVVPGHGTPSQNGAYLAGKYIEYLTELQELAAEAVAAGMNLTQAMAHVVQPDYQTYTLYAGCSLPSTSRSPSWRPVARSRTARRAAVSASRRRGTACTARPRATTARPVYVRSLR